MTRAFHQARWGEPVILELGGPGQRGFVPPAADEPLRRLAGDAVGALPPALRRREPPGLPEISQPEVLRHFLRLSQETMGAAIGVDIGQGTATMKFSPPVNEAIVRAADLANRHPLTNAEDVQGLLEVVHAFEGMLREISGMDRFSFQPAGGTHGIYTNARIMRAYHEQRGEGHRDQVVTTAYSHPADAAAPATAGYEIITVYPGRRGYVELEAVHAALSDRTAGLMIANPEDTGIFNPEIEAIVAAVHEAGGLCAWDWANANGLLGVVRAADAGFDLCQVNLHKTFGSPHASGGLACGAIGATAQLAPFLPAPTIERRGDGYAIVDDRPRSIGRVRAFHGVIGTVVRSYAWVLALGADGLRAVAETAVLNNNYLAHRLTQLGVIEPAYAAANEHPRLEQIRYTLAGLARETGVGTDDVSRRSGDFGVSAYFPSHHPWIVPEPASLEPTETPSQADLDEYAAIIAAIVQEARTSPETVRTAPERCAIHAIDESALDDPATWALTWRAHRRKRAR
jgi:glycine dehydrogenase subunit 2